MDEIFEQLVAKADQGNIDAMVIVADCYNRGEHTDKDEKKAQKYYKMAADQGNLGAMLMTGLGYLYGTGVRKNKADAIQYLQVAADRGLADAQYMMGILYNTGDMGMFFKSKRAAKYLKQAAKQGHAKAQIALGDMNIMMKGAQFSLENGLFWLVCAYMHGNNAFEDSEEAKDKLNTLINGGLPGGLERINQIMETVKEQYIDYTNNPELK